MTHGGDPLRISEKKQETTLQNGDRNKILKAEGTDIRRGWDKEVFSSLKQTSLNRNRVKSIL